GRLVVEQLRLGLCLFLPLLLRLAPGLRLRADDALELRDRGERDPLARAGAHHGAVPVDQALGEPGAQGRQVHRPDLAAVAQPDLHPRHESANIHFFRPGPGSQVLQKHRDPDRVLRNLGRRVSSIMAWFRWPTSTPRPCAWGAFAATPAGPGPPA